jgi:hypothetical protein
MDGYVQKGVYVLMPLSVSFSNPDFPEGLEFDIGLGVPVPNGKSVELDHDAELSFVSKKQMGVKDYFKDSEQIKVSGSTELDKKELEAHLGTEIVEAPPESLDDHVVPAEVDSGDGTGGGDN